MTTTDSQKHLLTLIRDVATEKSHGERRLSNLKKRIVELKNEIEAENEYLDESKCKKEVAEQELKGLEVELAMNDASIQALEMRSLLFQDEISKIGVDVEGLKYEEGRERDEFIKQMIELNNQIRRFQEDWTSGFNEKSGSETLSNDGVDNMKEQEMQDKQDILSDIEDKLAQVVSETQREDIEFQNIQVLHMKVQQEQLDLEKKVKLIESVVKETKELHEMTKQTAESEEACAYMGAELQKRCACPRCHSDNIGELGGALQAN